MIDTSSITLEKDISKLITEDRVSKEKSSMEVSLKYYNKQHDILNYRLFYVNNDGQVIEEKNRSNIKIAHAFYTEQVDQKVNYLLANPIEFKTKNERLAGYIKQYMTPQVQLLLQEAVEGASLKGSEAIYYSYDKQGTIQFDIADAQNLIMIPDENGAIKQVLRNYIVNSRKDNKPVQLHKAELYTEHVVYYFVKEGKEYKLDTSRTINPAPHKLLLKDGKLFKPAEGRLPFLFMDNNKQRTNDLDAIKNLIDDYDLMASALSNNITDFDQPIYAVSGYDGDSLDHLVNNLKTRKTIVTGDSGSLDVKTVDIPVEARKAKLAIDKENIYKFGMAFDSSQSGDGNITNIVIQSRYSLLNIKCNKTETRLRKLLDEMLELIVANIKELTSETFETSEVEVVITRKAVMNDKELAEQESLQANAKLNRVNAIMNSGLVLDDSTVAELLAKEFGLDTDSVVTALMENPQPRLIGDDYEQEA